MNLLDKITAKQINPNVPEFRVGYTVSVGCKIIETKNGKLGLDGFAYSDHEPSYIEFKLI